MDASTQRIRALNDALRTTLQGGRIVMTGGVQAIGRSVLAAVLDRMQRFSEFTADNDPHGEHDFGSFEVDGTEFFFKIDYYDKCMAQGSEDPSDPANTTRVLTLMLASEY
ncbi:MAG: DUF3768 domain-containing protein [Acidobacteriaceae bacterium]